LASELEGENLNDYNSKKEQSIALGVAPDGRLEIIRRNKGAGPTSTLSSLPQPDFFWAAFGVFVFFA
jgi:hypothetical protein